MECVAFFFPSIPVSNFVKAEIFSEKISPAANISTGNQRENDRDECEKNKTHFRVLSPFHCEALLKFKSAFYEARTTLFI